MLAEGGPITFYYYHDRPTRSSYPRFLTALYQPLTTNNINININTNNTNTTNNQSTISIKMVSFHITEPHPSVGSSYIYSGRGGAGNAMRIKSTEVTAGATASGPASRVKLTAPPTNAFYATGRGGAGNMKKTERAMFSFDEELAQQERLRSQQAPVYHIGRGGAGNLVDEQKPRTLRTNSASSASSVESEKDGVRRSVESAWNRLSRRVSNQ